MVKSSVILFYQNHCETELLNRGIPMFCLNKAKSWKPKILMTVEGSHRDTSLWGSLKLFPPLQCIKIVEFAESMNEYKLLIESYHESPNVRGGREVKMATNRHFTEIRKSHFNKHSADYESRFSKDLKNRFDSFPHCTH